MSVRERELILLDFVVAYHVKLVVASFTIAESDSPFQQKLFLNWMFGDAYPMDFEVENFKSFGGFGS